ncbi:unnamed protein product [Pylaiella littoralis]
MSTTRPTPAKRRKVYRPEEKPRDSVNGTYALYKHPESVASALTDEERAFFLQWVTKRNIDKAYFVLALTYWMRVRSKIWTYFLIHPKEFYMIVCIHIALKWLGYDEVLKCQFVKDLREIAPISMDTHQEIEFMVLAELGWDL